MNEDSKPFNQFLCHQLTETEVSFQHGSNQPVAPRPQEAVTQQHAEQGGFTQVPARQGHRAHS